jgi:hypothetical protein
MGAVNAVLELKKKQSKDGIWLDGSETNPESRCKVKTFA